MEAGRRAGRDSGEGYLPMTEGKGVKEPGAGVAGVTGAAAAAAEDEK